MSFALNMHFQGRIQDIRHFLVTFFHVLCPEHALVFTSLQPPCVTLKLSLQNLQYANDAPLLLTVISSGRVQEDKNLAGFLFAGGSILFFPYKLQKFPESRRRCGFLVKIRKNTEGWQHCMICITP